MKKVVLFLAPFLIATILVVGYFGLTRKISTFSIPTIPSVSFSDLVKFTRFSLEKAPSQSLVGTVTQMSGEIEYQSRLATESAKINSPVPVQQGERLTTGEDGKLILTFEKGVELSLSPETSLGVIQTLPADLVFLQSMGTVEFKKLGTMPVSIRSRHLLIENNGDISISIDKLKPVISVTVNSGSATFAYNNKSNISQVLTVNEGHELVFNDDTRRVIIK